MKESVNSQKPCIAFDIGEVLCHINWKPFKDRFLDFKYSININFDRFMRGLQKQQDIGVMTVEQYLIQNGVNEYTLKDRHGLMGEVIKGTLVENWNCAVEPCQFMIDFKNNLLERGINIALLSNIGITHLEHIRQNHKNMIDGCIEHYSCEVGARKPSKLFFQSFLLENPEFYGSLYVDDRQDNLDMAEKCGFRPYLFNVENINSDYEAEIEIKNILGIILRG
jgi:FMN phosphatase YigB (HAD superfamily)